MAFPLDLIDVGAAPDDGTGDGPRESFLKVNALIEAALYGGVVDAGSNVNGSWIRLAIGVQLCWARNALTFGSGSGVWAFPKAFAATPIVVGMPRRGDAIIANLSVNSVGSDAGQVTIARSETCAVDAIAIGTFTP